jgi:hypothetical protein
MCIWRHRTPFPSVRHMRHRINAFVWLVQLRHLTGLKLNTRRVKTTDFIFSVDLIKIVQRKFA